MLRCLARFRPFDAGVPHRTSSRKPAEHVSRQHSLAHEPQPDEVTRMKTPYHTYATLCWQGIKAIRQTDRFSNDVV